MPGYIITNAEVFDKDAYGEYGKLAPDAIKKPLKIRAGYAITLPTCGVSRKKATIGFEQVHMMPIGHAMVHDFKLS